MKYHNTMYIHPVLQTQAPRTKQNHLCHQMYYNVVVYGRMNTMDDIAQVCRSDYGFIFFSALILHRIVLGVV